MRAPWAWMWVFVAAAGCNNPSYLFQSRPLETRPGGMGGGYQADTELYVLPVRMPTQQESVALMQEQQRLGLMMPVPWAGQRDFDLEIRWSIKNLENQPLQASFNISGGSEFGDYVPDLYVDPTVPEQDQVPPPPLLGGTLIDLAANEVRAGVFREDELKEAGLDLEAITRYPAAGDALATPFQVLVRHSSASRVGLSDIPKDDVMPAMVRYQMTFSATGHAVVDYSVRVRDHAGKLARPNDMNLYVPADAVIAPPVAPPAAIMMMP